MLYSKRTTPASLPIQSPQFCWTARKTHNKSATIGRQLLESIVDQYLSQNCFLCSPEYREGLVDGMCSRAFGAPLLMRFKRGSVQYDAFMSGVEHGLGMTLPAPKGGHK